MKQDPHWKNLPILLHNIQKVKQPEILKFKVKSATNNTEKSSSDNQSETGNTDSTNNSTKEIDINVTTEPFMKKL